MESRDPPERPRLAGLVVALDKFEAPSFIRTNGTGA